MAEYDSSVALAKRMIKKKGQPATLRTFLASQPIDPDQPWVSVDPVVKDQTVNTVWLDYAQQYIDGDAIRTGDQRVFAPATDTADQPIDPAPDSRIIRGSQVWQVVRIKPLSPGGPVVMYEIQVRQ